MAIQRDKITASAEKLVARGKIEAAIKEYERLIEENPGDVNTLNRIGDLWGRINRNDEAVKVFTRIADHYSKDGFFLKAIAIYKKINKLDPSKLEIYGKLAELYARQGLAMEAKSQYQVLADYYMKHGDPANALVTYRKISELDPNSININVKMADLYSQTGQTAEALEQYEKVGRALLKRGMHEEAGQVFRKAVRLAPDNLDLADTAVRILTEAGDTQGASEILRGALEKAPANPRLIARLGRTYLQGGDVAAARKTLENGVSQNPTDVSLRDALASVYLDEGDTAGAWRTLAPVIDDAIGRGETDGAIESLEKIVAADPVHVEALARLTRAYDRSGDRTRWSSAMTRLSSAYEKNGDFDEALRVASELAEKDPSQAGRATQLRQRSGGASSSEPLIEQPSIDLDLGEGPSISIDEGPALDLDLSLDEPAPVMAVQAPSPAAAQASTATDADEDLDFVTEHLTEAEVFAKYGLTEKAVEHLTTITARYPANRVARERLVNVWLEEGDAGEIARAVSAYAAVLRDLGDTAAIDSLRGNLESRGFEAAAAALRSFGSGPKAVPSLEPEPVESAPATPEPALSDESLIAQQAEEDFEVPEIELDLDAAPDLDFGFGDSSVDLPSLDLDTGVEAQTSADAIAADSETAPSFDFGADVPAQESETPLDSEAIELGAEMGGEVAEPEAIVEPGAQPEVELDFGSPELDVEREAEPEPEPVAELTFEAGAESLTESGFESVIAEPSAEELGEIDFYLDQGLVDEADQRLSALELQWPGRDELVQRRERVESVRAEQTAPEEISALDIETELMAAIPAPAASGPVAAKSSPQPPISLDDEAGLFDDEDDFFDLAAELEQELQEEGDIVAIGEEEQSLEEIFREFKKGVEQQLDSEDYETHYNLGIAYKEMGLIDEAIAEFQLASKDPRRMIECCSMLGLCFLEKGMPQLAIKWYQKGLEAPEITEDEQLGLMYDLGAAYLEVGDVPSAQKAFVDIYGVNSSYRDVADRIRDLEDVNR